MHCACRPMSARVLARQRPETGVRSQRHPKPLKARARDIRRRRSKANEQLPNERPSVVHNRPEPSRAIAWSASARPRSLQRAISQSPPTKRAGPRVAIDAGRRGWQANLRRFRSSGNPTAQRSPMSPQTERSQNTLGTSTSVVLSCTSPRTVSLQRLRYEKPPR